MRQLQSPPWLGNSLGRNIKDDWSAFDEDSIPNRNFSDPLLFRPVVYVYLYPLLRHLFL